MPVPIRGPVQELIISSEYATYSIDEGVLTAIIHVELGVGFG